jgi:hypothetical protein
VRVTHTCTYCNITIHVYVHGHWRLNAQIAEEIHVQNVPAADDVHLIVLLKARGRGAKATSWVEKSMMMITQLIDEVPFPPRTDSYVLVVHVYVLEYEIMTS